MESFGSSEWLSSIASANCPAPGRFGASLHAHGSVAANGLSTIMKLRDCNNVMRPRLDQSLGSFPTVQIIIKVHICETRTQPSFFATLLVRIDDSGSLSVHGLYGAAMTCSVVLIGSSSVCGWPGVGLLLWSSCSLSRGSPMI